MKQCTIKYLSNLSVYGLVAALAYLFIIGSLGAGTVHIRFDPSLQPRKIVNCHRDDLISPTGKLKTPLDHALDGKHPWHLETYPDIPQLNIIKLPLAAKLKKTLEFKRFQERKLVLENACSMARRLIFTKNSTFDELKKLQQATLTGQMNDDKSCTPVLPIKSAKNENFYSDKFKYSMCLPPKTGCTNWQRGLVALLKNGEKTPEDLTDYEVFYDLDRFNSTDMKKERATRGSAEGYLTLVNTRHPLARLLSAWHDKFRKGHPWMKYIEKMYGNILKKLEKRDMTLEKFTYSFEAFMELAAASNHDWMRDQHWRSIFHHCTPCANEFDFIVKQESAAEDQRFILKALEVDNITHIPGAYYTSLTSRNSITFYFKHVPRVVLKDIYRNYFLDFAMFNYTIDEFLEEAVDEKGQISEVDRKWARVQLNENFIAWATNFKEYTCQEN